MSQQSDRRTGPHSDRRTSQQVDIHVGARIRARRAILGMTQEELAASLGISNQQVQKYETGANRVSASRLFELARKLDVDISFFFEGLDLEGMPTRVRHGGKDRMAIELMRNFLEIKHAEQRSALAHLVKTMTLP